MRTSMKSIFSEKCIYVVIVLFLITCGLIWFAYDTKCESQKLVDEVEYYDSLNRYNKIYYSKVFDVLKNENKDLYDSLKHYKNKLDYVVQFYHEKQYNTGNISTKPTTLHDSIHDTITIDKPLISKTYQYVSEPNDTFQYKLNVNSYTEPNWYSIQAKIRNKFTIVNKEENGANHIVIDPNNGGNVSDVTVWKKDETKKTFWDRVVVGPSFTAGYDVVNKQWGMMAGASVTLNLK